MKKRNDRSKKNAGSEGELVKIRQEKKNKTETQKPNSFSSGLDISGYDLFSHVKSGIAVYEAIDGGKDFILKDFNAAAEKIDHKQRENMVGRRVTEVYPGVQEMKLLETLRRVWKTGKPENHPVTFYKDNILTGWRENYIYKASSGEIIAIFEDLTESKAIEERISWLASFPELNPLIIVEIDFKGKVHYSNPSAKKQFPDLEAKGLQHPFLKNINQTITKFQKSKFDQSLVDEVEVADRYFSRLICHVENSPNYRIYAMDNTDEKHEELIRQVIFDIMKGSLLCENLDDFLSLIHTSISKLFLAENFSVVLHDKVHSRFNEIYFTDKFDKDINREDFKKSLTEYVFQTKKPLLATRAVFNELRASKKVKLIGKDSASWMGVPLIIDKQSVGVMVIQDYEKEDRYSEKDLDFFNVIAGQVAQVIQRKKAQEFLKEQNRMLRMLSATNQALIHINNEKELIESVCEIIVNEGAYRMAWIGYAEQNLRKSVTPIAQNGFEEGYLDSVKISWANTKFGQGPTGTAIRTNKISIARNIPDDPNYSPWRKAAIQRNYRSSIAIPLSINGKVIGAVNIYSDKVDTFNEEEIELLSEMAGDLSYGIASLRMRDARIQAEETLRESEEKFKFVFENSVVGKSLTSISGEIHVNKAFCDMLGYSPEELQNKRWQDITHPDDIEKTEKELNTLISREKESIRFVKRYIKKDGSIIWADILTSLRWDNDNKPMYFITAIIDLTERIEMEQKLKESNDFQKSLFETTSMATSILEKDMTISKINHAYEQLTGYSKEEVEGKKKWIELVHPDYLEMMMNYHERRRTDPTNIPKHYEFRLVTKNNDYKDIFLTVDLIPGTQKSVASFLDMTERKKSEKALQEANTIINRSPAVAFLWKNEPGWSVEFVSENVDRLFGYTAEDFIDGKVSYVKCIHKEDLNRVVEEVSKSSNIAGLNSFAHEPYRIIARGNGFRWVQDITFIRRNKEGKITHYEGIVFDITEKIEIAEKLQISKNNYRSVVDFAPLIISNFLPDGTITFVNKAYCDFFGKEIPKVLGTNFFSMISSQDREIMKKDLSSCTKGSPVIVIENRVKKQGKLHWMRWTDCAFFDENGKIAYYQSYGQDIHNQRHMEQLLQALNRATISMETALSVSDIFNAAAKELKELDTTCMFLPMDDKQGRLFTKYLYYDSKLLNKAEQLVGLQHEKYSFPIEKVKPYDEAIRNKKVIFIKNTEPLFHQILPYSAKIFAKQIIRFLNASKSIIAPLIIAGKTIGVFSVQSDFLTENDVPIFTAFNDQLAGAWKRVELLQDLKKTIDGTILTIAATVEMRDPYTAGHQTRVANLAAAIARELDLSQEQIESIHMAGIIHDLGKINVPAEILSKPGKISKLEFEIIKTHPQIGYDLLKKIEFPWPIAKIVLQHHEKMDGSGYPSGLKGEEIMIEARILCVADIVEAMSSHRPYRPSMGIDAALAQIKKDRGKLLDPQVVDVCLNLFANGYQFEDEK